MPKIPCTNIHVGPTYYPGVVGQAQHHGSTEKYKRTEIDNEEHHDYDIKNKLKVKLMKVKSKTNKILSTQSIIGQFVHRR
jgi:hypothetical protein